MDDACSTPNLQAPLTGVIHEDQRNSSLPFEIAHREVLDVSAEIRIADGLVVDDP